MGATRHSRTFEESNRAARRGSARVRIGAAFAAAALLASAISAGVPLTVAAAAGDFTVSPTTLDFGSVYVGATASLPITITNVSSTTQTPNFSGGAPNDPDNFGGSQNCAGVPLAPNGSCTFTYEFTPATVGPHSSSTTIGIDSENFSITMSGTGLSPFTVVPTTLNFGSVFVGATATLPITITNVSGVSLTPNYSGGAPNDPDNFGGSQNCAGVTLAAGGSCTFTYDFTPTTVGPLSSSTTIGIDDENFPITMSGIGVEPTADLAASIAASPNPVKARGTLSYSITVRNAGGSNALHVLLNDLLSPQSTFLSATTSQGSCVTPTVGASGTMSCNLGTIASGGSSTINFKVTVLAKKGTITNSVTVSTTTVDTNSANNAASITTRVK